jgi:hypothetical protein
VRTFPGRRRQQFRRKAVRNSPQPHLINVSAAVKIRVAPATKIGFSDVFRVMAVPSAAGAVMKMLLVWTLFSSKKTGLVCRSGETIQGRSPCDL